MTSGDGSLDLDQLLNPDEQAQFRRLCLATSAEELAELGSVVELHLAHVRDKAGPHTDLDMAERLARSLCQLLDGDTTFEDADDRALVRGAVEYFLMTDDASDDLEDPIGFDDDARILNSVLEKVGRPELRIEMG